MNSRRAVVSMMQHAQSRQGPNLVACRPLELGDASSRSLLSEREMGSILVVVENVIGHEPLQMARVDRDHMIEQIASTAADESFGDAVLPRTSKAGPLRLDAEAPDCIDNLGVEIRSPIED